MKEEKTPRTVIGFWTIKVGDAGKESYEGDTRELQEEIATRLRAEGKVYSIQTGRVA